MKPFVSFDKAPLPVSIIGRSSRRNTKKISNIIVDLVVSCAKERISNTQPSTRTSMIVSKCNKAKEMKDWAKFT